MIKPSTVAFIAALATVAQFSTPTLAQVKDCPPNDVNCNRPWGPKDLPLPPGPALVPAQTAPTTIPPSAPAAPSLSLTDDQVKAWIDKAVYSSDDKKLGEVAAFARDGTGKVTEMHADIGGFLGMGETRVRLTPAQFKLGTDRVVLMVTAEQAKTLPIIKK